MKEHSSNIQYILICGSHKCLVQCRAGICLTIVPKAFPIQPGDHMCALHISYMYVVTSTGNCVFTSILTSRTIQLCFHKHFDIQNNTKCSNVSTMESGHHVAWTKAVVIDSHPKKSNNMFLESWHSGMESCSLNREKGSLAQHYRSLPH